MNKGITEEVLPTYPTFSTSLGVLVSDNNDIQMPTTAPVAASATAMPTTASTIPPTNTHTATPIIIQMPSFQYLYSSLN